MFILQKKIETKQGLYKSFIEITPKETWHSKGGRILWT